jgi:hypothetical protein
LGPLLQSAQYFLKLFAKLKLLLAFERVVYHSHFYITISFVTVPLT